MPAKILIVDDDPVNLKILTRSFSKHTTVIQATDGVEGLQCLQAERPEFVVTDMHMPNMDGIEMLRALRRSYYGAATPVLMLTAEGQEERLLEAFRSGCDDYMVKPFSIKELLLRVSSIYLRQRMARDVNPLTRLPGNMMLKHEISERLSRGEDFAIAYVDLDHFKAFNDYQGFDRGDFVIQLLADLMRDYAMKDDSDLFLGHVGGDDFVFVMPISGISRLEPEINDRFAEATRDLYEPAEIEQGYFEAKNRKDELERFDLLSISIGVLTTEREGMNDLRHISQVAAEVKKMAKGIAGNSVFIDRRS